MNSRKGNSSKNRRSLHYRRLERMYLAGSCNQYYQPQIKIEGGWAEVSIEIRPDFFHSGGAVHGSVYFKVLDQL